MFAAEQEALEFIRILREVAERDDLTVLAWCLLSSHYHLAVRSGAVPLDRPMRSLQQRVTRGVNRRQRVWGPLWQGRFKVKIVDSSRYIDQLLAYIHLNPVAAGIVDDPAEYEWSGHLDLLEYPGAWHVYVYIASSGGIRVPCCQVGINRALCGAI